MSNNVTQQQTAEQVAPVDKGKGKAVEPIETEDESSDDEMQEAVEEPEEDELAEIDTNNIITSGRRTRGKQIDFAKAAAEEPTKDDEDDDDDDDFEAQEGDDDDAMDTK